MAIQVQGNGGTVAEVDGTTFRAMRTTPRPIDHGAFGHYRLATTVALVVTQAANGTLFSFRWGDATRLCVIGKIKLSCLQTTAATATIMPSFEVLIARSFTVSDSVGTALTLTGNSFKKRTSMGTTLVTDIRKAAVAAGLTAGTRTLDSEAIMQMPTQQTITTPNATLYTSELDIGAGDGNHPLVFAQNEGFIVRGPTVIFGAAGTANLVVDVCWAEVTAY
jgi:hypothetical protein